MLDQNATDQLRRHLQDLPELYVYASLALEPGSATREGRVTGATRTAPLPCRVDLLSHLAPGGLDSTLDGDSTGTWPVITVLDAWAHRISRDRRDGRPALHIQALCWYLLRHLNWSVQQAWADTYAAEIAEAVWPLQAVAPSARMVWRRHQVFCPRCHRLTLIERQGAANIECSNEACKAVLTPAELDELVARTTEAIEAAA